MEIIWIGVLFMIGVYLAPIIIGIIIILFNIIMSILGILILLLIDLFTNNKAHL